MGRKLACWKCGETSHLALSSSEKKDSGIPAPVDKKPPLSGTDSSVASTEIMPAASAPVMPSMPASAVVEKVKRDRLLVGKDRGKHQRVRPQSPDSSTAKYTNSPVSKISVKGDPRPLMQECRKRFEPFNEKREKFIQLKEIL